MKNSILKNRLFKMGVPLIVVLAIMTTLPCLVAAQSKQVDVPDAKELLGPMKNLPGKAAELAEPAELPQAAEAPISQADIDAIKAIRQRMGGGVAEKFKEIPGFDAEALSAEVFDSQLKRMAGIAPEQNQQPNQKVAGQATYYADAAKSPAAQLRQTHAVGFIARNNGSTDQSNARVVALRSAARHLELAAADLEDVNLFQPADELRKQAKQLRVQARGLNR